MMSTTWHIQPDPTNAELQWAVVGTGPDEAWPYFFSGFRLQTYPRLMEAAASQTGYDSNGCGFGFPAVIAALDPQAPPLPPDAVEVYMPGFAESVLPRTTFYAVLLAFGERLTGHPGQSPAWHAAMQAALNQLRIRIAAVAAG